MGRRTFLAGLTGLAGLGATLVACAAPETREAGVTSPAARRGRVTLSWPADTGYPSPFAFSPVGPGGVVKLMLAYDTLTWKDRRGVIPWLAERWSVAADGRSYTFTIRDGVRFHDGTALTAEDVAFTFGYFARFPFKWTSTTVVERAEAIDGRTVRIGLAAPHAPFLEDIAGGVPILPRHVWEPVGDPLAFRGAGATVGSGPFAFVSYADGRGEYLYRAQDQHFGGRPAISELAYVLVPDAQRTIALQTHAADLFLATEYELVTAFANGEPYKVFTTPGLSVMRLILNVDRAPLSNVQVRQAIAYALDRGDIAARVTHAPDVIVGSAGLIPPDGRWASPTVRRYPFDPSRARALLDGAGLVDRDGDGFRELPGGAPLTLDLIANPAIPDAGLVVAQLRDADLRVRIVSGDAKTRTDLQQRRAFHLALTSHIGIGGDPDFLRLWFSGAATNAFAYGDGLHSARFDTVAALQAREHDPAMRRAQVAELQDILAAELPTLPLYYRRFYFVYDPRAWDRWSNTAGGIMNGIPLIDNKLAFLD